MKHASKKPVRSLVTGGTAMAAAALIALAAPLAAQAHVTVAPGQADVGSWTTLTFKVPNESATAGTVGLAVMLPTDTPFTSVSYQPVPGWSAQIETAKLPQPIEVHGASITEAPSKITWTADEGTSIAAGQFQQFVISAGPVPDTGHIILPAHQTYSDGSVVAWDEVAGADGAEPAHPAPTLYVNDEPAGDGHSHDDSDDMASVTPSAPVAPGSDDSASAEGATSGDVPSAESDDTGVSLWVAFAGLGLGAIALVVAVAAFAGRNKRDGGVANGAAQNGAAPKGAAPKGDVTK